MPSQLSSRGLPLAPAANPKVDAGYEDVAGEELLRRFNWQVSRAGVAGDQVAAQARGRPGQAQAQGAVGVAAVPPEVRPALLYRSLF